MGIIYALCSIAQVEIYAKIRVQFACVRIMMTLLDALLPQCTLYPEFSSTLSHIYFIENININKLFV